MRHKVKRMHVVPTMQLLHRTMNTVHGWQSAGTFWPLRRSNGSLNHIIATLTQLLA
jgi:hypothetical protein